MHNEFTVNLEKPTVNWLEPTVNLFTMQSPFIYAYLCFAIHIEKIKVLVL